MTIQVNTDEHIAGSDRAENYFSTQIEKELDHFAEHITRVEVHLSDENADKSGPNDKKCVIEARMRSRQPIAVTAQEENIEKSFKSALGKVKSSVSRIVDKMHNHR